MGLRASPPAPAPPKAPTPPAERYAGLARAKPYQDAVANGRGREWLAENDVRYRDKPLPASKPAPRPAPATKPKPLKSPPDAAIPLWAAIRSPSVSASCCAPAR